MAFAPGRARNQHSSLQLILFLAAVILLTTAAAGETCTTQSALTPAQRASIAAAAHSLTAMVQADNTTLLRSSTTPEISKDFTALQSLVASTAPRLAGGVPTVDQIYLLDATSLKPNADGTAPDAQFYCSLNRSTMEVEFTIPSLPPGIYAFAMVDVAPPPGAATPSPYRLSYLLHQDPAQRWLLAGFYPRAATAAGHDGLWYWTHARQLATNKQPWNAWLYYQAAIKLLDPAPFVNSTHLDKLRTEAAAAAPPALSEGISVDAPLVVKAAGGAEYRFTALTVDDSLGLPSLDIEAHLQVESNTDPIAARKRNNDAASALLAAYPELRGPFHGVWIYAEAPNSNPFATEQPMADIK